MELWAKLARRYKDEPTVAAYDLLNEPLPARTGAAAKYKHLVEPLYRRITTAIRDVDKQHMITLEGIDWANDWSIFSAPFDDNAFYQFHYYCWDHPVQLHDIGRYLEQRERLGTPVWVGETGEKNNLIYWATTAYFEANNIGWSFWPWKKMETQNTPYSIPAPRDWDAIRPYSRGGPKPAPAVAQRAFDQLLRNIRLENCVYFPDVVNAIFRRAPVKIEAENYGFEGLEQSYFVTQTGRQAEFYRRWEPVPISIIHEHRETKTCEYAIELMAGEWTEYRVNATEPRTFATMLRARANETPTVLRLSTDGYSDELTLTEDGWNEIALRAIRLSAGTNQVRLHVKSGSVAIDWLTLE